VLLLNYPRPLLKVECTLPLEVEHNVFTFVVDIEHLIDQLGQVPDLPDQRLRAKAWNLLFRFGDSLVNPVIARDLPSALPEPRVVRGHRASLYVDRNDVARLMVRRV
jgi:hypothetical protein